MKAVVAAFNQEKALVGAFSVLMNLRMELFQALPLTQGLPEVHHRDGAGGAAAGQGPAVAADQGEHPGGPGHHQQHKLPLR